jgi:hypothetical protein
MADVIPFKRPSLKDKARGKTLCARGFHEWAIDQKQRFDVKEGRLVTVRRCIRCGVTRTTLV